jgi:hypothetical protein
LPEVVFVSQAIDAVVGQTRDLAPESAGLIVGVMYGDTEAIG